MQAVVGTLGQLRPTAPTVGDRSRPACRADQWELVHPDVAASTTVGAYPFWLAITPYPGGDPHFENPSLFQSANGRLWQVPAGLTNPAFLPRTGYLSDPDVLFDAADGHLWMYYRQVVGDANVILLSPGAFQDR